MNRQIEKEIDLSKLPKWGKGGKSKEGYIDWENSIGYKVKGIYDSIEFEVEIVDYVKNKKNYLIIKYNDVELDIATDHFSNCKLGKLFKKVTSDFKFEIGTHFKDEKRDVTVTDRKKIQSKTGQWCKYYKYKCNRCGFECGEHYSSKDNKFKDELWILEGALNSQKQGCSCCCNPPQIVVEHINSLVVTEPWMIQYFQGGYDEAKLYTKSSNKKIRPVCPDCGIVKDKKMMINTIFIHKSIGCSCSDSIPYSEKFMFSVLEQLGLEFKTQLNKTTFDWCQNYKYDFYFELDKEQYIIETNGSQHYKECTSFKTTLEEVQLNDGLKKKLALKNGIKEENYIVIDCRESTLKWVKEHIVESNLANMFDLSNIDWLKCEEFALSNLVKTACNFKRENSDITTNEISNIMGYNENTICRWLKKGTEVEWCKYDAELESFKGSSKSGKMNGRPLEIFKNEISLGVFKSAREIDRISEKLFGVRLNYKGISSFCTGRMSNYKGFTFKYISKEEYDQRKSQENLKQVI